MHEFPIHDEFSAALNKVTITKRQSTVKWKHLGIPIHEIEILLYSLQTAFSLSFEFLDIKSADDVKRCLDLSQNPMNHLQ